MKLYIGEKHSQAEALARYLARYSGSTLQTPSRHFFAVGNDLVTWASGHLFTDGRPEDYDPIYKSWDDAHIPIIPDRLLRIPAKSGVAAAQLVAIRAILPKAEQIIHACDYDREGQMIGDDICEQLGATVPVLRLPLVGYDDLSIQRAFEAMAPNERNANLSMAARVRRHMDWIHGINGTRKLTNKAKARGYRLPGPIPVGRVISPMLGLIAMRERQIQTFVPTSHYTIGVCLTNKSTRLVMELYLPPGTQGLDDEGRLIDRAVAMKLKAQIEAGKGVVTGVEEGTTPERAPLPYSMSSIQMEMSKRHKLTAKQTYTAVQRLYNQYFLISYPRGNCRYYESYRHVDGPATLRTIADNVPDLAIWCSGADPAYVSPAFDTSKVGAHPAIAPLQTLYADELPEPERWIYEAICRRYIQQFYGEAQYLTYSYTARAGGMELRARKQHLANDGWLVTREDGVPKEKPADPCDFAVDDALEIEDAEVYQSTNRVPKRFTDGSLMAAINSVEKFVEDPELKKLMGTNASIGTEATQTQIIENLIASHCIERREHFLVPTKLGMMVAAALPPNLQGPGLTAISERDIEKVAVGAMNPEVFMRKHIRLVIDNCAAMDQIELPPADDWNPDARDRRNREPGSAGERSHDAA